MSSLLADQVAQLSGYIFNESKGVTHLSDLQLAYILGKFDGNYDTAKEWVDGIIESDRCHLEAGHPVGLRE